MVPYLGVLSSWKKSKNPRKTRNNQTPPTDPTIHFFFFNIWKHENNTKNTKKHNISKKKNPSWGLTHPPTSEFFSDFWNFFNLKKTLNQLIPLKINNGRSSIT